MILKLRECSILSLRSNNHINSSKEEVVFSNADYFDIFDEVDAQMHPKKSFVYSIGTSSQLDEEGFRANICIAFI